METTFRGIVGTPVTPLTADNHLDRETIDKLINFLIESGVETLALPMHIGESLNLSVGERKELAEFAVKVAAGRVPVIVNVSLAGTDQVVDLARHGQGVGAAAVLTITPYHWRPSPKALLAHFAAVGAAIDIPFLAYNFPAKLGVSLTPELVIQLIEQFDNFVGMKDASYDMKYFTELCRVTSTLRPAFSMFVGTEFLLPSMIVGGAGAFSALGAIAPRLVRELYSACSNKEFERALCLQHKVSQLWNLIKSGYPATVKAAMEIMGRPTGGTRLPLLPLSDEAKKRLRQDLDDVGVLDTEPHGWTLD